MISVSDVSLRFSEKPLFKDVNLKFTSGNCYGIIGANGAGKSTFLKVLSGELEHDTGTITMSPGERMSVLKQDHFAYDEYSVMETVLMGYPKLYECSKARDEIYSKADFTEELGSKRKCDYCKSYMKYSQLCAIGNKPSSKYVCYKFTLKAGLEEEYKKFLLSLRK